MKKIIVLAIASFITVSSCSNEPAKNANIPLTKVEQVDENCSKVEVTLFKGGTVTFTSSSKIKQMIHNKQLDHVTVYRVVDYSETWEVDDKFPEKLIDTTLLLISDYRLRKLQYRQGFISAIYK